MKPKVLNRDPDNFFAQTEQLAFGAAHVVPGIDFSNDPLLADRIHSYLDTQITRLGGANFHEIPIDAPLAPQHNNQRDGLHGQAKLTAPAIRERMVSPHFIAALGRHRHPEREAGALAP